ncbi:ankyrin-1-like [Periplaneta americana]|uniref:ankyrin-1-like n=1 Tax=Periplaneta americana TaxID=6978 RepID=UPI0037E8A9F4
MTRTLYKKEYDVMSREFENEHMLCSLSLMFSEADIMALKPSTLTDSLKKYLATIENGTEYSGIIDRIENGKVHFIHHSFTEYFCALWFKKNYDANKDFLRRRMHDQTSEIMWRMLDYMFSENCDLHLAVLNTDLEKVKSLLSKGSPVNQKDFCGRSPLHLASIYNNRDIAHELMKCGADLSIRDCFNLNPLDYCDRAKAWATADLLLRFNKDTLNKSQRGETLFTLKRNIKHPQYGIQALEESGRHGYVELTKFLFKNGLDLRKTSLNNANQRLLHIAALNNQLELVNMILKNTSVLPRDGSILRSIRNLICFIDSFDNINTKDINGHTALMYACNSGNLLMVRKMVKSGASIKIFNSKYLNPLYFAAKMGHLPVVEYLLKESGVHMDEADICLPLHIAVRNGHVNVVTCFLQHKIHFDMVERYGHVLMTIAIMYGQFPIVVCLLQHGIEVSKTDKYGQTLLHIASRKGHSSIAQCLLQHGAGVNIADKFGRTPLHFATEHGHVSTAEILLQHEAEANVSNRDGWSLLHIASQKGLLPIVQSLLLYGAIAEKADKCGLTPLHIAAQNGHLSVVQCLLEYGTDVNIVDSYGRTSLYLATKDEHLTVIQYLLQQKAEINKADNYGYTALHVAVQNGHESIVQCLLEHQPKVNVTDKYGWTPLHIAAQNGKQTIVKCLLQNDTEINIASSDGQTPLHIASQNGMSVVVEYLLQHDADVNKEDCKKYTSLHMAVKYTHLNIVKCLLQYGARVNSTDYEGKTPLHISAEIGNRSIAECLLQHNAQRSLINTNGRTPLQEAQLRKHSSIVELLLQYEEWTNNECIV